MFADCRSRLEADWPAAPFETLSSSCSFIDAYLGASGTGVALAFFLGKSDRESSLSLEQQGSKAAVIWNGQNLADRLSNAFLPRSLGDTFVDALGAEYYQSYKDFKVQTPHGLLPVSASTQGLGLQAPVVPYVWQGQTVAW